MEMFKVGDEVECVEGYKRIVKGMTGKVVATNQCYPPILVEWDDFKGRGHTGGGRLKDMNGYWIYTKNIIHGSLKLINE